MSPNFPGPSASPNRATFSSRTRKSKPSSSASTARNRKFPSASASSNPIHGIRATEKYPVGTKVKGKVRNLTSYGAFIELEEGIDGMIHVSDMSWTRKINHPSEVLKKGDEVEAVVLEMDKANQRIALGIKQLGVDPWSNIDKLYKVGDLVTGKVTKLASFGAFIGLQHEIDGLVHISQISEERVDKIKNVLKVGQEVTARVIKIDKGERRIGLSIKAANYSDEQLKEEQKMLDALKPGEDLVALQHAFDAADEAQKDGIIVPDNSNKTAGGPATVRLFCFNPLLSKMLQLSD